MGLTRSARTKLYSIHSAISGEIEVWQNGVERELLVNGSRQSILRLDDSSRGYWAKLVPESEVREALILGLGGGTTACYLRQRWPGVKIVSYELDPEMVRVATAFFDLDPKIEVITKDFREAIKLDGKFDLIIVDLYAGSKFVDAAQDELFIKALKSKLTPLGRVGFNRSPVFSKRGELRNFEKKLRSIFPLVTREKADLNVIYWGQV